MDVFLPSGCYPRLTWRHPSGCSWLRPQNLREPKEHGIAKKPLSKSQTNHLREWESTHLVVEPLRRVLLIKDRGKTFHLVVEQNVVIEIFVAETPHKLRKMGFDHIRKNHVLWKMGFDYTRKNHKLWKMGFDHIRKNHKMWKMGFDHIRKNHKL